MSARGGHGIPVIFFPHEILQKEKSRGQAGERTMATTGNALNFQGMSQGGTNNFVVFILPAFPSVSICDH